MQPQMQQPNNSSPFGFGGFTSQQSTGVFGSNLAKPGPLVGNSSPVGASPFGGSSSPAFSVGTPVNTGPSPVFGIGAATPSFGNIQSNSPFGGNPAFGNQFSPQKPPIFGNTANPSAFGNPGSFGSQPFGQQSTPNSTFAQVGQTGNGLMQNTPQFSSPPVQQPSSSLGLFNSSPFLSSNTQTLANATLQLAQTSFGSQLPSAIVSPFQNVDLGLMSTIKPIYMLANSLAESSGIFNNSDAVARA